MLPVGYEAHCQSCHPLAFDERILEEAPQDLPGWLQKEWILLSHSCLRKSAKNATR